MAADPTTKTPDGDKHRTADYWAVNTTKQWITKLLKLLNANKQIISYITV
jgi:hypothetical protein